MEIILINLTLAGMSIALTFHFYGVRKLRKETRDMLGVLYVLNLHVIEIENKLQESNIHVKNKIGMIIDVIGKKKSTFIV